MELPGRQKAGMRGCGVGCVRCRGSLDEGTRYRLRVSWMREILTNTRKANLFVFERCLGVLARGVACSRVTVFSY